MKTRVLMEEKYATLSIAYKSLEKKEKLLESINEAIKKVVNSFGLVERKINEISEGMIYNVFFIQAKNPVNKKNSPFYNKQLKIGKKLCLYF